MLAISIVLLVCVQGLYSTSLGVAKYQPINVNADDVPESCNHLTYCTAKPKDYPENRFNEMVKRYTSPHRLRQAADGDTSLTLSTDEAYNTKPFPQRFMTARKLKKRAGDTDDEDDCESEVTYELLYKVREKSTVPWRTVIQAPGQNFVQRVQLERCINSNARCFKVFAPVAEYVTFCKQNVNTLEVLVAKGDNETEIIKAELPVSCSCHYRQNLA